MTERPDWLWEKEAPFEWDAFWQRPQVIQVRKYIEELERAIPKPPPNSACSKCSDYPCPASPRVTFYIRCYAQKKE